MESVVCPRCRGRGVGRVGLAQWYCWDCCVEFARSSRGIEVYVMDEEGELVSLEREEDGAGEVARCEGSVAAS